MKISLSVASFLFAASLSAQYITPSYRTSDTDADFAFWWGFDVPYTDVADAPPFTGLDDMEVNYALYGGGNDIARMGQYGEDGAFITSSYGIYSFGDPTAFKVYDNPSYSPGEILFQTVTFVGSQSTPDVSSVKLYYRSSESDPWTLANIPMTAEVNSTDTDGHMYTAWEWDTSSLVIADFYIDFAYPLNHSSIIEAQLDTNETFVLQIDGNGINVETNVPSGISFGSIHHENSSGVTKVLYNDGEVVTITATPNQFFEFVKWVTPDGDVLTTDLTVTIEGNVNVTAVFAAKEYSVWRQFGFPSDHGGGLSPSDYDPANDYDNDGKPNVLEYGFYENPESGVASANIYQTVVNVEGVNYPAIVFPMQVAASDLIYTVSVSHDLSTWNVNGDGGGPYTVDPEFLSYNDNGTQQVLVRSLTPLTANNPTFFQINVELD